MLSSAPSQEACALRKLAAGVSVGSVALRRAHPPRRRRKNRTIVRTPAALNRHFWYAINVQCNRAELRAALVQRRAHMVPHLVAVRRLGAELVHLFRDVVVGVLVEETEVTDHGNGIHVDGLPRHAHVHAEAHEDLLRAIGNVNHLKLDAVKRREIAVVSVEAGDAVTALVEVRFVVRWPAEATRLAVAEGHRKVLRRLEHRALRHR